MTTTPPESTINKLLADTLEIIQRAEHERLSSMFHQPFPLIYPRRPHRSDVPDSWCDGLWFHDELFSNRKKGNSTMSKKQITIETSTRPQVNYGSAYGKFVHKATASYGETFKGPTVTATVELPTSQQAAAEQLLLDMADALTQARAAYEAAGLVKPQPAPAPAISTHATRVAQALAEMLTKDVGEGGGVEISRDLIAEVEVHPSSGLQTYNGKGTERVTIKSPNGTLVHYTRTIAKGEALDPSKPGSTGILDMLRGNRS